MNVIRNVPATDRKISKNNDKHASIITKREGHGTNMTLSSFPLQVHITSCQLPPAKTKCITIEVSMLQISHCKGNDPYAYQVLDLLALVPKTKSSSPKGPITVRSMAAKFKRAFPSPIRSPQKSLEKNFGRCRKIPCRLWIHVGTYRKQKRSITNGTSYLAKSFANGDTGPIIFMITNAAGVLDWQPGYGEQKIMILHIGGGLERSKKGAKTA